MPTPEHEELRRLRAEVAALREGLDQLTDRRFGSRAGDLLGMLREELATLRERDLHYRAILSSATDYAVIVTDLEAKITEWNLGAEAITGWTRAEMLGRRVDRLFTPEDRAAGVPAGEMEKSVERGRAPDDRWHLRKDGGRFFASGLMMPLRDDEGAPRGWLKILQDRTPQHQVGRALADSEARLQALFEAVPVGLLVAEAPSGRLVRGNPRLSQMFGRHWPRSGAVSEYGAWECFHPDGRRFLPEEYPLTRALAGEERPVAEALVRRDDDSRHWVRIRGAPIRDAGGTIVGGIVSVEDIDASKRLQEVADKANAFLTGEVATRTGELRDSRREAVASEGRREAAEAQVRQLQKMEAVGQLTGGVAHDFNNMLAVIISALRLTQRRIERGDPDIGGFIDAAMDGAKRAASLTQRLLAFSRQSPLSPVPMDANRMVQGMSELLHRTLGEEITLETVLGSGLWRTHADASELENAILNLAVNARDAMPGGGRLTVETSNAHLDEAYAREHGEVAPGQYVLIAITDTGSGIPPEVLHRVFEPFFTTKATGKGTGLGLSQVYGFVKQSRGHLKVYSETGQGTTIKVYLPRFYGQEESPPEATPRQPLRMTPGRAEEVVLVVEDEARVRELTVATLRDLGYTVIHAEDAAAALHQLDAHPEVTLLFTDIVMPGMNGRRLADEALRRRPDLRVIFATGYTRNAVVHNGVLDQGVDLLVKPYSVEALATKVREVLDRDA